jgi:hypothetical protein
MKMEEAEIEDIIEGIRSVPFYQTSLPLLAEVGGVPVKGQPYCMAFDRGRTAFINELKTFTLKTARVGGPARSSLSHCTTWASPPRYPGMTGTHRGHNRVESHTCRKNAPIERLSGKELQLLYSDYLVELDPEGVEDLPKGCLDVAYVLVDVDLVDPGKLDGLDPNGTLNLDI